MFGYQYGKGWMYHLLVIKWSYRAQYSCTARYALSIVIVSVKSYTIRKSQPHCCRPKDRSLPRKREFERERVRSVYV